MILHSVLILLLVIGAIWAIIWFAVITSVPHVQDESIVDKSTARLRRRVVLPFIVILIIGLAFSFYWMPYPNNRARAFGAPEVTVDVMAAQWSWTVSQDTIPVGTSVEFAVTSKDVNHGFAIYSPAGEILTQVQAMPGYTNRLIYKFDTPGEYIIRCLEYCGVAHDVMVKAFTVE